MFKKLSSPESIIILVIAALAHEMSWEQVDYNDDSIAASPDSEGFSGAVALRVLGDKQYWLQFVYNEAEFSASLSDDGGKSYIAVPGGMQQILEGVVDKLSLPINKELVG